MSEYQYYEFVAVDRPLDDRQLRELRALSTRAQITPTSFVNEYHWGDFRGDPPVLMERYFDAFLYLANWGTHRLMFRLPARVLNLETAQRYCDGDYVSARPAGDHVILDFQSEDESGGWVETGEGWLTSLVPARAELATGDLRALYLSWLLSAQSGELDDDEVEPPVPAGLRSLSASLSSLADFLRIDADLLDVAATASKPLRVADLSEAVVARWVDRLPEREKNDLLVRVIQGDGGGVRTELLRGLNGPAGTHAGHRTVGELLTAAETHRVAREREAERQRAEERAQRELAAATAREKRLETVARQEERIWRQVSELIDTKKQSEYDSAVALLEDLRAVGERTDRAEQFERRVQELRLTHRRKPSLIDRLDRAGLGQRSPASAASSRSR
ncbi:MAG TPA: hypothetical protein VGR06_24945 [Actinophytocola sp.]|uniref:hypothetical protein n=1 Tax=Actinophytocola sp. TaxID=1872138 RepID=UPI002DF9ED5B|nr:hypothetical protein [Actinophytocola sp.]